jgi:hypothetical protein
MSDSNLSQDRYNILFLRNKEKAFKIALDTRKFELELYWKRASYYWVFIATIFAGFFLILSNQKNIPSVEDILILIACTGFIFSIGWLMANRGSKYWTTNWEKHVDMLENEVIGPLFKTRISKSNFKKWKIHKAYPHSVAKINQMLNIFIIFIWAALIFFVLDKYYSLSLIFNFPTIVLNCTVIFLILMFFLCNTEHNRGEITFEKPNDLK